MEFFNPKSNIDFMGARKWTAIFSIVLFAMSLSFLFTKGLKWGLDFTGGNQIEVSYQQPADLVKIREQLSKAGFHEAQVVSYGTSKDVLISIAPREGTAQADLLKQVMTALPGAEKKRSEYVGPQVGKELAFKGTLAVVIALLTIMIYIGLRFERRFGVSAVVALIHDPILILGMFALFQIEFDLKALAALLAVIGYSLNDTIVVFDRVRENFKKLRRTPVLEVMNLSINETLSRTIMTSFLTLLVLISLLIYGGESIRNFGIAFAIGIVIGTYSSIYVAGALAVTLGLSRNDFLPKARIEADDRP